MIKLGIFVNKEKDKDFSIANNIIATAKLSNVQCEFANIEENYDVIISLGGDGTFLAATRRFLGVPILGVNLGHLGFLSESSKLDINCIIYNLINEKYRIEERFILEADINGEKLLGLNDIVINRADNKARLVNLNLFFNDKYADKYMADGLIISTPTGSTAYSLSAGGPIVDPKLDVVVVTPICAHSLHQRPIIVGADTLIKIESELNDFIVTADGQVSLKGNMVSIRRSDKKAKVIKFDDRCFFDIVREKFHLS